MKKVSSLFAKILFWFLLNVLLIAVLLSVYFAFQSHLDLHRLLGRQAADRLRTAASLIAHDLMVTPHDGWVRVLRRHAETHRVDFAVILPEGPHYYSSNERIPEAVVTMSREEMRFKRKQAFKTLTRDGRPPEHDLRGRFGKIHDEIRAWEDPQPSEYRPAPGRKRHLDMRTDNPRRYWRGLPLNPAATRGPAVLLAFSAKVTGSGFFFDPLPWLIIPLAILLLSVILWIPLVRHITRPLTRMTAAAERISKGRFDVRLPAKRRDEIGRLAVAINQMTSRLKGFVAGQKRFLGDVAHELGSPIARIQFGLGALEQRVGDENRERVAEVIEDVNHLSNLVNELMSLQRAELKPKQVKLHIIPLAPIIRQAVMRERNANSEIAVRVDPHLSVSADPHLLARAVANLVRNAVKYAGDDGPIVVDAQKSKAGVEITVRDQGPGVPADCLGQLFDPFFRPELSRTRDSGGVGLGLAIVKTCVEACQGTVQAANLKPRGFAVTITLGGVDTR